MINPGEEGEKKINVLAITGTTFPWKDKLDKLGFKYGPQFKIWYKPVDEAVDLGKLIDEFNEYGFPVNECDTAVFE